MQNDDGKGDGGALMSSHGVSPHPTERTMMEHTPVERPDLETISLDPLCGQEDEIYTEWWTCPVPGCGNGLILGHSNYCADCGRKIVWAKATERKLE